MGDFNRNGSRGYILAMLLAFIVAGGVFLTVAMPRVITEVQRDQEAELVFRGEAIARAIRMYKAKTGTYPLSLEDLLKQRPPVLRKLYKDPMVIEGVSEGDWDLITAVQPGASGDKTGLPIVGVRSHCQLNGMRKYGGKELISDWTFSATGNLLGIINTPVLDALTAKAPSAPGGDPASAEDKAKAPKPPEGSNP